jgi:hypothetical protein
LVKTNKEISRRLAIGLSTVKNHVHNERLAVPTLDIQLVAAFRPAPSVPAPSGVRRCADGGG